jgi:hypothetical protein
VGADQRGEDPVVGDGVDYRSGEFGSAVVEAGEVRSADRVRLRAVAGRDGGRGFVVDHPGRGQERHPVADVTASLAGLAGLAGLADRVNWVAWLG